MFHISSNGPCLKYFNHTFVNTDIINIVITDIKIDSLGCRTIRIEKDSNNRICNIKSVNAVLTIVEPFDDYILLEDWFIV